MIYPDYANRKYRLKKRNEVIYGQNRMGKTTLLFLLIQTIHKRGKKCFLMWDPSRQESAFLNLPNEFGNKLDCRVFVPLTDSLPDKIPDCFHPFTIPCSTISLEEWQVFMGNVTKTAMTLGMSFKKPTISEILFALDRMAEDKYFITDKTKYKAKVYGKPVLASISLPMIKFFEEERGIIANDDFPLNIDLEHELKHPEWITAFNFKFVKTQIMKRFIFLYLFNKIYNLQEKHSSKLRVMGITEFSDLCPNIPKHFSDDVIREQLSKAVMMSMGNNLKIIVDAQEPSKVYKYVRSQLEHMVYTFRLVSSHDLTQLETGIGGRITLADEDIIRNLRQHNFVLIDPEEQKYWLRKTALQSLDFQHREEGQDFFKVWNDGWIDCKEWKRKVKDMHMSENKILQGMISETKVEVKTITDKSKRKQERLKKMKKILEEEPHLTDWQLAERLGVSDPTIQNYKKALRRQN